MATNALTKVGQGLLKFGGSGANLYTGVTTVAEGTLELNKAPGVTAVPGSLTIGNDVGNGSEPDIVKLDAAEQISSGATVTINSTGQLNTAYGASSIPDDVQTITVTATSGSFTVSFDGSFAQIVVVSTNVAQTAINLQSSLAGIPGVGNGNVSVSGALVASQTTTIATYSVTFTGSLAGAHVGALTVANSTLAGTGAAVSSAILTVGAEEVETVSVDATAGSFTLAYGNSVSSPLTYTAGVAPSASSVQTALSQIGISSSGSNVLSYTGSATTTTIYQIVFNSLSNAANLGQIVAAGSGLTGGISATSANQAVGQVQGLGLGFTGEQTIAALTMAEGATTAAQVNLASGSILSLGGTVTVNLTGSTGFAIPGLATTSPGASISGAGSLALLTDTTTAAATRTFTITDGPVLADLTISTGIIDGSVASTGNTGTVPGGITRGGGGRLGAQ